MKFTKFFLACFVYIILGLFFLWFLSRSFLPPGYILSGHDSGLPLDAEQFFLSRFFAWDDRIGFGFDNSHLFGSLTLHFIDYLSAFLGGTIYAGNWLNLFFWLAAIFIAGFIFAYQLKDHLGKYFIFIFPPLIIFNFYLFQSIFILERAKYSILVAILIFLSLCFRLLEKKISIQTSSILSAIVFFFFNGGSLLGIPLYGSFFVIVLCLLFFYFLYGFVKKNFSELIIILKFLVLTGVFLILLNSYQILPYLPNILSRSYFDHLGGSVSQSLDWVIYISQNTSYINLFRLQGIPPWFSNTYIPHAEHPYSQKYLEDPLLVFSSFLIPVVAFSGLILAKDFNQRKILFLFSFIFLISMVFSAGTHPPLGAIYALLYNYFPGFYIFRTPYYKFASALTIAGGVLIAASMSIFISYLIRILEIKNITTAFKNLTAVVLVVISISTWLVYHNSLFIPEQVFAWKKNYLTRSEVPQYIWDFKHWIESENKTNDRILLIPPVDSKQFSDSYTWGYWSLSPVTYSLTTIPSLISDLSLNNEEKSWVDKLYSVIKDNNEKRIRDISSKLGIRYFVYRKDTTNITPYNGIKNSIDSLVSIDKVRSFGQWDVYKIKEDPTPLITATTNLSLVQKGNLYLGREFVFNQDVVAQEFGLPEDKLEPFITQKIHSYICQSCLLEKINTREDLPPVRIFSNSPFYFLKEIREKKELDSLKNDDTKVYTLLTYVLRRVSETRSMIILGAEERYLLSNLKTVNSYLEETSSLLARDPNLKTDYEQARYNLDISTRIINNLRKLILTSEFGIKTINVRNEVYRLLWLLEGINDLYSPLLTDQKTLRDIKIYFLGSDREYYIDTFTFPINKEGKLIMPSFVTYSIDGLEKKLTRENGVNDWVKIELPTDMNSKGILKLQFDFVNLLELESPSLQPFPTGEQACLLGKISNFRPGYSYEINISSKNKAQKLRLFFQFMKKDNFIEFERGVDINPLQSVVPYRYLYESRSDDPEPTLFLCSGDKDLPDLNEFSIYQLISPNLIGVEKSTTSYIQEPKLEFKRLNPTMYNISTASQDGRFVLSFNQRFNHLWNLYKASDSSNNFVVWFNRIILQKDQIKAQFNINGYKNAWFIDAPGKSEWVLVYAPQILFYLGSFITVIVLAIMVTVFIIDVIRDRRQ